MVKPVNKGERFEMPAPKSVTINFDSNISKVVYGGSGDYTWTTSGETLSGFDWTGSFVVTLNAGYVIDSITTNNVTTVKSQTDTTFTIEGNFTTTAIITITSKQSTPTPTLTFKHFYDAGTIGSGTIKFRHYSQQEPSSGETWVLNETVSGALAKTTANFTSNSEQFTNIRMSAKGDLFYGKADTTETTVYFLSWTDTAYRTITFDEPVIDTTLLTWLQANGTKQGGGGQ